MSSSSTPASDAPSDVVYATLDAAYNWPSHRSIRAAAVLLVIASGVSAITVGVLAFWGWKPSAYAFVATGLQTLLAIGLLLFGRRAAIPTLAFLAAAALRLPIQNAFARAAMGLEFPVGVSVMLYSTDLLIASSHVLPFALLLIGKQSRTKYAIALAAFMLFELLSVAGVVVTVVMRQRGLSH